MGPSMVRAARKTDRIVRDRVRREARAPRGGNSLGDGTGFIGTVFIGFLCPLY